MAATLTKETFLLTSSLDGLGLSGLMVRTAEKSAKGVVVLCHGMCEHKERYLPFMTFLAEQGYHSLMIDHRGHGKSVLQKEDLGFLYAHGERALVEDLAQVIDYAKERFPGEKVHLFGHSMGSLVVRIFLQKRDRSIDSLVVSGCVAPNPAAGVGGLLARVMGMIKGQRYRSAFLQKMAFGAFNKPFGKGAPVNSWLSSDPKVVEAYNRDPLCGFNFTINGYTALMKMMQLCYKKELYEVKSPELPILFISGQEDPCCSGEKGFRSAVSFLKERGYTKVESRFYPGMRHEVLNELEKEKVYQDVVGFLES